MHSHLQLTGLQMYLALHDHFRSHGNGNLEALPVSENSITPPFTSCTTLSPDVFYSIGINNLTLKQNILKAEMGKNRALGYNFDINEANI